MSGRDIKVSESVPACLKVAGKGLNGVWKGFKGVERAKGSLNILARPIEVSGRA